MLWLLASCSDYSFERPADEEGGAFECGSYLEEGEDLDQDDGCIFEEVTGSLTNIIDWQVPDFEGQTNGSDRVGMTPILLPLTDDDGDGTYGSSGDLATVVVVSHDTEEAGATIRAVTGDGDDLLFSVEPTGLQPQSGLAGGDLDGDGRAEVVGITSSGVLVAVDAVGEVMWTSEALPDGAYAGQADNPAIADLDGDGSPEVLVGAAILDATGEVLAVGTKGRGGEDGTTSFGADLDGDGTQELITGNAAYAIDGTIVASNDEDDGYVAAADLDGDGEGDLVVSAGGLLRIQDTDYSVLNEIDLGRSSSGPPAIADLDGDSEPEIVVTTETDVVAVEVDGTVIWRWLHEGDASGTSGLSIYDFERDGMPEVVHLDEYALHILRGATGERRMLSYEHTSDAWIEYGVIGDVDGDDQVEIAVGSTGAHGSSNGVTTFGAIDAEWPPGRKVWNQYAYFVTNVNDDGTIPSSPDLNWSTLNTFRSGDLTPSSGTRAADLLAAIDEVCTTECSEGRLTIRARVGNQGTGDALAPVTVELWAEIQDLWYVVDEAEVEQAPAGSWSGTVEFEVESADAYQSLAVTVDGGAYAPGGGSWRECVEDNNVAYWEGDLCQ